MRPSLSTASAGLSVWNGSRPGASKFSAPRCSEKLDAAVLHQHAGARQHAAGAELPIERLDVGHDEAAGVGGAHPHGVGFRRRAASGAALRRSIFIASPAMKRGSRQRSSGCARWFGSVTTRSRMRSARLVASTRPWIWSKPSASRHAQARKQGEDHQRGDALGRRVGVVDRARRQFDAQRLGERGAVARQILARDRAADADRDRRRFRGRRRRDRNRRDRHGRDAPASRPAPLA